MRNEHVTLAAEVILIAAREKIAHGYTTRGLAQDDRGRDCCPTSVHARKWSIVGALAASITPSDGLEHYFEACRHLLDTDTQCVLSGQPPIRSDAISLFDRAIFLTDPSNQ